MSDRAEQMQLVEDCERRESRLGDWERGFIDSIKRQLEQGQGLMPKQDEALNEIWDRMTAKG